MTIENLYNIYLEHRLISTDSRQITGNSIFFALKGSNFNGNKFALEAVEKGCSFAVVDDPSLPAHPRLIRVPEVLKALQELAHFHRKNLKIPFLAITGSNGKTTTKELTAAVLGKKFRVNATKGNLNNHIGVPLTILAINSEDFAIIEMGANHEGEIEALCRIAEPDFGVITNIGRAHLEGFGSPEGVIRAKSELYRHLNLSGGLAFTDAENNMLVRLVNEMNLRTVWYGEGPGSLCSGSVTGTNPFLNAGIRFHADNTMIAVSSSLVGDYNLRNILAAACIGAYFNVMPGDIAQAISQYIPSNNRSQLLQKGSNRIVMDAYNANPSSMERAITNFLSMEDPFPKLIILGDMLELGTYSPAEHASILDLLKMYHFSRVFLVGPEFCKAAGTSWPLCFGSVEGLIEHFRKNPVKEQSILLKGSRGMKLEKLLEVL